MKRLLFVVLLAVLSSGCVHRWVGRPVELLEKEYGSPRNIRNQGDSRIFYYPDLLAGRGEMTFTVDRRGIIRSWCATSDVPGPWLDDIVGGPLDGPFTNGTGTVNSPNVGLNSRIRGLPTGPVATTCR